MQLICNNERQAKDGKTTAVSLGEMLSRIKYHKNHTEHQAGKAQALPVTKKAVRIELTALFLWQFKQNGLNVALYRPPTIYIMYIITTAQWR